MLRHELRVRIIPLIALAALVLLASACVKPQFKPFESLDGVKKDELIIVGKFILVPKLGKDEQTFSKGMFDKTEQAYRNKVFLLTGDKMRQINSNLSMKDYGSMIVATFDEPFYVKGAKKSFIILAGMIKMQSGRTQSGNTIYIHDENTWLPGGLKVNVKPTDRAIYIGTVRYHRNEFFDITKARVIDEFSKVRKVFRKKYGKSIPLKKRLVQVLKSGKKKSGKKKKS